MKRVKLQLLLLALIAGMMTTSCAKKDIYIDLTSNDWEIVKIKKQGESSYTKAGASYILSFTNEQTYALKLDVNNCFGDYEITSNGNIVIGHMGCTEVCCDSEFAQTLLQLFPKMTKYYGKGDELIFEGEGKIVLKKK